MCQSLFERLSPPVPTYVSPRGWLIVLVWLARSNGKLRVSFAELQVVVTGKLERDLRL
jgi:hypothetical protein